MNACGGGMKLPMSIHWECKNWEVKPEGTCGSSPRQSGDCGERVQQVNKHEDKECHNSGLLS